MRWIDFKWQQILTRQANIWFLKNDHELLFPSSTAKEVEAIVQAEGATPATVGVIEGEIRVGLSSEELDYLAQFKSPLKVSRRDLPYVISKVRPLRLYLKYKSENNLCL